MGEVFRQIINLSVSGSFLIGAVIAVRFLLRKGSKSMICILWILVGIRFLLPVSIESVFGVIPGREVVRYSVWDREVPVVETGFDGIDKPVNRQIQTSYMTRGGNSPTILDWCTCVWIAGMVLLTAYFVWSWRVLKGKVKTAVPEYWCGEKVYVCDEISSPFLMGMVHPRIFLPRGMAEEAIPYVVAHEMAHKKRRDYLTKWIASLFLIVYWFHPLIWLSYVLLSRDLEFACDEQVIQKMGEEHKKNYSNALLSCTLGRASAVWYPTAFGEVGVKTRIRKVFSYKKPALWGIAAAAVLILLTAICFLTQKIQEPRKGSVITYGGCQFILEEAVFCRETGFIKMVIHVRADENPEVNVRDLYALVSLELSAQTGSLDVGENEWKFTALGCFEKEIDQALTLTERTDGREIGRFSTDLVQYEEAKEFITDSYAGRMTILVSEHSMKVLFEDGIPAMRQKGLLAIEMKNGEKWKAVSAPLRVGLFADEFERRLDLTAGMEREEDGMIFSAFANSLNLKDIQAFELVPKDEVQEFFALEDKEK